ncbi:transposase [Streptomyces lydicus]|uniref:transposase n=1 Tax=Streptomyces lydicus TaxID=47763 RepID=UPI00369BED35
MSAGRQYSGAIGGVGLCQVAVHLAAVTATTKVIIDRALYLPSDWAADEERREVAGVPEEIAFATKPQQALTMVTDAFPAGLKARWFAGDEVYCGHELRRGIRPCPRHTSSAQEGSQLEPCVEATGQLAGHHQHWKARNAICRAHGRAVADDRGFTARQRQAPGGVATQAAATPPTFSLPPSGLPTSSLARWAYGSTVTTAKQTPQFPCLEDRCRHQGLNNTTFDIDASNGSVTRKETDSD